jgi:hypothetical protein
LISKNNFSEVRRKNIIFIKFILGKKNRVAACHFPEFSSFATEIRTQAQTWTEDTVRDTGRDRTLTGSGP